MKIDYSEMTPTRARIMMFHVKEYLLHLPYPVCISKGNFEALIIIDDALAALKG